jgi:hypothetical protein
METIAYGDGFLHKAASTLSGFFLPPSQDEIKPTAMRVVVDFRLSYPAGACFFLL